MIVFHPEDYEETPFACSVSLGGFKKEGFSFYGVEFHIGNLYCGGLLVTAEDARELGRKLLETADRADKVFGVQQNEMAA